MKTTFYFTFFLTVVFVSSCMPKAKPKDPESLIWEASLKDVLPSTMVKAITSENLEATIPIVFEDNQGNKLSGATFTLQNSDSGINLKADSNGMVILNLTKSLIERNPVLKISNNKVLAKNIRYDVGGKTVVFQENKSINSTVVSSSNLNYLSHDGLKVYYLTDQPMAKLYLDSLCQTISFIKKLLNKDSVSAVSPVLTTEAVTFIGEPKNETLFPVNINKWEDKYWYFVHECTEKELIIRNDVYSKNPSLRWVGDGIAEFTSLQYLKSKGENFKRAMLDSRIRTLLKSSADNFDLNSWKATEDLRTEGYSYSLAFWLKAESLYSLKNIQKFVSLFSVNSSFDSGHLKKIYLQSFGKEFNSGDFVMSKKEAIEILQKN